jgi:hypothetical protein
LKQAFSLKIDELARRAEQQLRTVLSTLPESTFEKTATLPAKTGPEFQLKYHGRFGSATLLGVVKAHLWPSEVASVAHQLRRCDLRPDDQLVVPIVMAPWISPLVAEQCAMFELNWADLAGNCNIAFDGVYLHVEGKPNPSPDKRGTGSLYSPRSARVVHALLLQPKRAWKVVDLADLTGVSLGQVSNVCRLLVQSTFASRDPAGLHVTDPKGLLGGWSAAYRPRRVKRAFFTLMRMHEIEDSLVKVSGAYAMTEFAAAERYAPYTRYQTVACYIPEWDTSFVQALDLRPAEGAANALFYEDPEGLFLSEVHRGVRCASPVLTYLDLMSLGGRGQGAAEFLLETVLMPRWQ